MVRIKNLPTPTVKAIKFEKICLSFFPCRGHKRIRGRQTTAANRPKQTDFSCFRFQFVLSVHCVLPFFSTQCFLSVHCLLPFVSPLPFHALLLSFRSMSYVPFVTSSHSFQLSVSFQLFVSVHCVFPFVSPFPYYALLPSARFKSYILFVFSSLSFQLFPAVCSGLPSDLPVSSQLFLSVRCVLSFISSLLFHLLLPFFRINSYVLFVSFFLPFQLFLSIRCVCAFVSTLLSCSFSSSFPFTLSISLRPSFRFNSSLLFVISFLSFQLSPHVSQKT